MLPSQFLPLNTSVVFEIELTRISFRLERALPMNCLLTQAGYLIWNRPCLQLSQMQKHQLTTQLYWFVVWILSSSHLPISHPTVYFFSEFHVLSSARLMASHRNISCSIGSKMSVVLSNKSHNKCFVGSKTKKVIEKLKTMSIPKVTRSVGICFFIIAFITRPLLFW